MDDFQNVMQPIAEESKRFKVLLVSFFNDEAYGIRSLHSTLIENAIDAYMLFFKVESKQIILDHDAKTKKDFMHNLRNASDKEIALLVNFITENQINVIGFSLVSSHFYLYKRIYERIRNIQGLTIVIGGWQPSLNPDDCISYTDYLCIGEGEVALRELIDLLATNKNADHVLNFWINKTDITTKNPVRPLTRDLSSFPSPVYEHKYSYIIENDQIVNFEPAFDNSRYGTFIGRGCPFQCTYCSNSFMANIVYPTSWSRIRYRSIDHVKKEMVFVKSKLNNVRSINFYDEVFSPSMDWIRGFFSWYEKEINIPFYCFFFPGSCSEEKCRTLARAGLHGVWIGVQSGSLRVRKEIFKRMYTNKQVIEQANIFHKYNVSVRYDFIFDNPFESFEESVESILLMLELPQPFTVNLFSLKYFPNTEITKMALSAKIIVEKDLDDNLKNDQDTYLINRDVENIDNRFINHMAFYISCMSQNPKLLQQKDMIVKLINNYKNTRDITEVVELIAPFL